MKKFLCAILSLVLFAGMGLAEEKIAEKVVPKIGIAVPKVRPLRGKFHWNHPVFGWGYWAYPAPAVAVPENFYLDEVGRIVPNGYVYDPAGELVALTVVEGVYVYPYHNHHGKWRWRR